MSNENVIPVKEGSIINNEPVLPSCGENHGSWYCATHSQHFHNNFYKDEHLLKTTPNNPCAFVWVCRNHGYEAP